MSNFPEIPLAVLLATVLTTHFWFRNFEPRAYTPVVIGVFICPVAFAISLLYHGFPPLFAVPLSYCAFHACLLTSIVAYRLSPFHPLANYPGPWIARTSKIWTFWKSLDGKLPQYYQRLHAQYGSIVRVGPNELSVVDKDLIPHIIGNHGMPKGPLWEGRRITPSKDKGNYSLIGQRDSGRHAQLRKAWNRAFSAEPLNDYAELLFSRANELALSLGNAGRDRRNENVNIAKWISFFSFDFMCDLAFGGGSNLLQEGDKNKYQENMEDGLLLPALTMQIPWLAHILQLFPVAGASTRALGAFAVQRAKIRSSQPAVQKDLFYHLVNNTFDDEEASTFPLIVSNAVLAIIAGSDTTASVLSNAVYYLLSNPTDLKRLQDELDETYSAFRDGLIPIEPDVLAKLPWLNAIINETMRLQPPVPTGLQRAPERGTGGKMVGTHFMREGTAIQVPPYVLHRDPRYFSPDPEKFWPERWVKDGKDTNIVLDTAAFIPFSAGPANCAGKQLAMIELRYVISLLFSRFNMRFAEGWDQRRWEENLKDRFVMAKGELMVDIQLRKSG
ncbi:cytochrome P450 [Dendrothele bispora CBS 962.96]|uniref:Cytochrome P450 n=1 Tax=Dendrothele bispora (strain CBS 962.96) TaxID=1314807 RepID=A0A4S8M827_DENBC|nr:cytochrome P450 [Dendrothele bispora CBS 962.96]